jgi:hypothetical protein
VVVGQIVGVAKKFRVPQLGKIKMDEIVVDAVFLVMLCVKKKNLHIALRPLADLLSVLYPEVTVGVKGLLP